MAFAVGVPVVADHQQQQVPQAAAVDDGESSPPTLHRRRSANYEPTTWDYDSICSLSPLGSAAASDEEEDEEAAADAADHLLLLVPTIGGSSSSSISSQAESIQAILKDSVRRMLQVELLQEEYTDVDTGSSSSSSSSRRLIRTIHQLQSFGIAYHFDGEIRGILMSMHQKQQHDLLHLDLPSAALLFRMLRGQGIPASTDMLMRALLREESEHDDDDKVVVIDRDALLALYQASYLAFPGETVLDQLRAFAVDNIAAAAAAGRNSSDLLPPLPSHWTAPRLQAMRSLSLIMDHQEQRRGNVVDDDDAVDPAILQLAQVDFNLVQALHRAELAEVTRWWKESRLGEKLPFARDRVVECFFCAACIAPEPHLAECREVLAKTSSLIVHLDDIYDVYGTLEELQAFTDAMGNASWKREHQDQEHLRCNDDGDDFPEYMKAMYSAIRQTSVAAADRVLEKHGYDMLPLYKEAWHDLCKAFLVEAQWQHQGYRPSFAEYISNGWVTSTGPLLLLHAFPAAAAAPAAAIGNGHGHGAATASSNGTDDDDDCPSRISGSRMVELSSTIFRLCNDCVESERGDALSSIACCMADTSCSAGSEEQACAAVQGLIAETWKLLNREVVVGSGNPGPRSSSSASAESNNMAMANLCLNLARIIHCIYQDGDGITSPTHRMKHMVKGLLFNPIPL